MTTKKIAENKSKNKKRLLSTANKKKVLDLLIYLIQKIIKTKIGQILIN